MEEVKIILFPDDMILYLENTKDSTKKFVRINKQIPHICKIQINTHKSVEFSCTKNELSEKQLKKTVPFIIESKIIKYLGMT